MDRSRRNLSLTEAFFDEGLADAIYSPTVLNAG